MPHDFDAIRTFDVFYKFIKIHNLHFDKNIVNMMNFVQHYIYNQPDRKIKPTPRMEDIFNRIIRLSEDSYPDMSNEIETQN